MLAAHALTTPVTTRLTITQEVLNNVRETLKCASVKWDVLKELRFSRTRLLMLIMSGWLQIILLHPVTDRICHIFVDTVQHT